MSDSRRDVEQTALAWLARVNDPDFDGWDAWEAWLAADPQHAEVYWRFAETEAEVVDGLAARPVDESVGSPLPVSAARRRRASGRPGVTRRWVPLAAAAAAVVLTAGLWTAWLQRPQTWTVETRAGAHRSLTLADGSEIHLDGATRVTLDRRRPRHAVLDQGRILVEVVHDDRRPFQVAVGDAMLTDLGTAFDVTRTADGLRVDVSEGVVRVDLDRQAVTLRAGEGIEAVDGAVERRTVAPGDVGTWREGRLVFRNERFDVVAEDLSRALGVPVAVDPAIAGRRFTGSLAAEGTPEVLRGRLELLMGVSVVEDGVGWRLQARTRE
ncbi:FecR family protein [Brevundimonas lenta]|uniref:Transmembrane sensor n=1 Tax=Brevundimonas lenta TaxID=424796 RepID=A0A7W6JEG0_9CAUL|nr:FecR domain-containing protein [Brevundimonas lenta]MBB4083604.1 transmembrane sensor [Brevundimonas lenta]